MKQKKTIKLNIIIKIISNEKTRKEIKNLTDANGQNTVMKKNRLTFWLWKKFSNESEQKNH